MKTTRWIGLALVAVLALSLAPAQAESRYDRKITAAEEVLNDALTREGSAIPAAYIRQCKAIAIFPGVVRGGFIYGARYGEGIVFGRTEDGKWTAPAFFSVTGGSFGLQAGLQSMDIVLLIMNEKGVQALLKQKFTIGSDIAVAAGPHSASAQGDIDIALKADILSYARSRGLFAGISVNGARMAFSPKMNREFYTRGFTADDILIRNQAPMPTQVEGIIRRLQGI